MINSKMFDAKIIIKKKKKMQFLFLALGIKCDLASSQLFSLCPAECWREESSLF